MTQTQQYEFNVPDSVKDNPRVERWYNAMVKDANGDQERLLHNLKAVCGYLIQVDNLRIKEKERKEELINSTNNIFSDLFNALDKREDEIKADNLAKAFGIVTEPVSFIRINEQSDNTTEEAEEWRPIKDYEGRYEVSNLGRVRSFLIDQWRTPQQGRILSLTQREEGYKYVQMYADNGKRKSFLLHRLVAQAFIPNPHNYYKIKHIDGDVTNNRADNLKWYGLNKQHSKLTNQL